MKVQHVRTYGITKNKKTKLNPNVFSFFYMTLYTKWQKNPEVVARLLPENYYPGMKLDSGWINLDTGPVDKTGRMMCKTNQYSMSGR